MNKLLVFLIGFPVLGYCALAPLPQSIREIEAILHYPALNELLPQGSTIEDISRVSNGYIVVTNTHILNVKINYDEKGRIGPRKFTLEFSKAIPLVNEEKTK
jgi:hypothetical protein